MDWSWLREFFSWIVQVNSIISNFSSVLGSVTVLGAAVGFVLSRRDSGFGPKYDKETRYYRFFEPLAEVFRHPESPLTPPPSTGSAGLVNYTSVPGLKYRAHFVPNGHFGVYLNLVGSDSEEIFERLRNRKCKLESDLGLNREPGFLSRVLHRKRRENALKFESPKDTGAAGYRITLYYPGEMRITASGRQLKRVRRWAQDYLLKFQQVFDQQVPAVQRELARPKVLVPDPVPTAIPAEVAV